MARQAVLERLGWKFIRIRGSEFFRKPEVTMRSVVDQITQFGIEPVGADSEPASTSDSELLGRIKSRAEQIRAAWSTPATSARTTAETDQRDPAEPVTIVAKRNHPEEFSAPAATVTNAMSMADQPDPPLDQEEDEPEGDDEIERDTLGRRGNGFVLTAALTSDQLRAAIYAALPNSGAIDQELLIRSSAAQLGLKRIRKKFRSRLNKTIGAEVRYGRIARNADWDRLWRPVERIHSETDLDRAE